MSRFYGSLRGGAGEVTRTGTKGSGIVAHPRGWSTGVKVVGHATDNGTRDAFSVFVTGGSNDGRRTYKLAEVIETDGGRVRIELPSGQVVTLDRNGSPEEG